MTTTKDKEGGKKLSLKGPGKLELKKTVERDVVRQSFSHGRTKAVQVEVRKKRVYKSGEGGQLSEVSAAEAAQAEAKAESQEAIEESLKGLTPEERERRLKVLETAKQEQEERARQREEEQKRLDREAEERKQRQAEEAARRAAEEEEERKQREEEERAAMEAAAAAAAAEAPAIADAPPAKAQEGEAAKVKKPREKAREEPKAAPARPKGEPRRRQGKLTITQALSDDEEGQERIRSLAAVKRQREREKERARERLQEGSKVIRDVVIPEALTVQELANRMAERGGEVVKTLMKLGVMATINQTIDADTAQLVVEEFGHRVKRVSDEDIEIGLKGADEEDTRREPRAPVVTVMGHVDHGKTSLLDALRRSDVAAHEAGGITQHIGAYQVTLESGQKMTFIDTPGHAAFTEMRSRGANVTDLVVLVVAADDGIMEQTVEAINHAKAAEVPVIVAINKIDKPEADVTRVKTEMLQHELVPEDMGGDILCVPVSAVTGEGLADLQEAILLQAELLDLKANPDRRAEGVVIEAKLEQGRGSVATVLIQRGTLRVGDIFVTGSEYGRVRALLNDRGENVESAGPSEPVEVLGLNGTPFAGDDFVVVEDDARARDIASYREQKRKKQELATQGGRGSLEQMLDKIKQGEAMGLPVVIKSDVHGSLEAIQGALEKLGTEEVEVRVLHAAVGGINESDVTLARASGALVIAFNVRANAQAREMARRDGVEIRYYSIIYDVVDDVKAAMSGMLSPDQKEKFLGYAEIREVFNITKVGKVAGCYVTEGTVKRGAHVRLLRDNVVIHDGKLRTLKRFKDEVREVQSGYECGMAFENYHDIQVGDQIECYEVEEVARSL